MTQAYYRTTGGLSAEAVRQAVSSAKTQEDKVLAYFRLCPPGHAVSASQVHQVVYGGIVMAWLRANGYDGLCNIECGCGVENLAPCGEIMADCKPAYAGPGEEDGVYYYASKEARDEAVKHAQKLAADEKEEPPAAAVEAANGH